VTTSPSSGLLSAPKHSSRFYGWNMVALCIVIRGFTAPGQTIGVSAFIDELIAAFDTTRSKVALTYLIGTIVGSTVLPLIGPWIDRVGIKRSLTTVSIAFACVTALTATVQNLVMLTVAFVGLRMLGQGAMSLIGTQGVMLWFDRKRGFALAVTGTGTVALLAFAPLAFGSLIDWVGWRWTWVLIGAAIAIVIVPIARFGIVDRPRDRDQVPDGETSEVIAEHPPLTSIAVMAGAFNTALTFHNENLLGEQGLTDTQAAAIFIPALFGSAVAAMIIGTLTDHVGARGLMFFGGITLALSTFMSTLAAPGLMATLYGVMLGVSGGSINALAGALYPKWFGVDHIGAIRALATTAMVLGSAVGPLLYSLGNDQAGSYEPIVVITALLSAVVAVVALLVPPPRTDSPQAVS